MIETVTIPLLLKAVDFLFEEGSKILEERRERRKAQQGEKPQAKEVAAQSVAEATTVGL